MNKTIASMDGVGAEVKLRLIVFIPLNADAAF